ncbi:hypothetical protein [Streptomyces sp. CB03238]|uniref:hypothetical protein n=1 Tax=Streptomyces sp. CB03238 TaxID=1907777 RepID=UPI000A10E36F|nr:hypothetical protein [Streptomyces sp. CB03238]ORT59295.1 hypothetical protein BKD26_15000 [Streptomyces sp. CB03238]
MIGPEKIPTFTGDLGELQRDIIALRQAAKAIRDNGSDLHTRFQHLSASYKAPEAGQLFGTTQAVQDTSGSFAGRLETVAGALETYAVEVVEIVKQLEMLRWQAGRFVESVKDQDGPLGNWRKDADKVAEHQALWDGVNAAVAAFQQAEVTCADKITALVGGTQWHINDGSPKQENPYGFSAEQLSQADSLPWGSPEHREVLPFGIDHHLQEFGVSLWDNASGSVEGLVDLFSPGEEGDAAREGLLRVIVGAEAYLVDPHGDANLSPFMKKFMGDSKPYAKEFATSFVAWDDWSTNPGKALGTVVFNGLTLGAGPLGAVSKAGSAAGKAGAGSRVAGTFAKVGEVLDPIGAAARIVGAATRKLPRVADLVAGVRGAPAAAAASDAAHSVLEFPDGSQLRVQDGQFTPGKKGIPDTTPAPHEPAAADRAPSVEAPHQRELVGVGARTPDATAHAGENLPAHAGHEPVAGSGGGSANANGRDIPRGGAASAHGSSSGASSPGTGSAANGAGVAGRGGSQGASPLDHAPVSGSTHGDGSGEQGTGGDNRQGGPESSAPHEPEHGHNAPDGDGQPYEGHEEPTGDRDNGTSQESGQRDPGDVEPDFTRPSLPPGQAELSLRELRAVRGFRERFNAAEGTAREWFDAGPERLFPVPLNDHPYYPVELPGGRKVDAPVDLPDGRTLAVEVKHYLEWRTITLADGTKQSVKNEVPLAKGLIEQINKDLALRRLDPGYDPRWVFTDAPPSQALRNYLTQARVIFVEYGPAPK